MTQYVKLVRDCTTVVEAAGRMLARVSGVPRHVITEGLSGSASYKRLNEGRIRLDITCMLATRQWWREMVAACGKKLVLFVFCDASPTWRGTELFAATVDVWGGPTSPGCSCHVLP